MDCTAATQLIAPFYSALTLPSTKDVQGLVESVVQPEWRSYAGEGVSKGRDEFIKQVMGFGKLIPDLVWDIKEVIADETHVVVRSQASGTPAGDFMGVPHSGRSFSIMTIDIHTVKEGKLMMAHHVEDWASALRQLAGK